MPGDANAETPATPSSAMLGTGTAGVSASSPTPDRFSLRRLLLAASPLGLLGALVALELPICPSRIMLGIPCPGCGLTRATEALVHGDLLAMLVYHPLAPIIAPVAIFAVLRTVLVYGGVLRSDQADWLNRVPRNVWTTIGFALVGLWSARALGLLGGLPDPLDPTRGLIWRAFAWLATLAGL